MRIAKTSAALLIIALALGVPAMASGDLQNGNFENWPVGTTVHPSWTGIYSGTVANQFARETAIVHTAGGTSQKIKSPGTSGAWTDVYQAIDTTEGDALTMLGWFYSFSAPAYTRPQVGINSSATRPATWLFSQAVFTKQVWTSTGAIAGNAGAGSSTYIFLETKRNTSSGDTSLYWDDLSLYHAYVPTAPIVSNVTTSSLDLDVDPGGNAGNPGAQYAITIGGGAYTLGTNWLQDDWSVSTAPAWQIDPMWGNGTLAGLEAGVTYTFQVKSRYSEAYSQETFLGAGAVATLVAVPEPSSIAALLAGLIGLIGVRRRK